MKSILVIMVCCTLFYPSLSAHAQKAVLSLGPEVAFPGKTAGTQTKKTGAGGSFRFESLSGKHLSFVFTAGYISFGESKPYSYTTTVYKVNAIPVQLGIKYYTQAQKEIPDGFFLSAEAGYIITGGHINYPNGLTQKPGESGFGIAIGPGYFHKHLDLGMRAQFNLTNSGFRVYYYNVRVAYALYTKKKKG